MHVLSFVPRPSAGKTFSGRGKVVATYAAAARGSTRE